MVVDESLGNGPTKNRSCTDPFCCLLFIVFIVGTVAAGFYGYINGKPELLLTVYDFDSKLNNSLIFLTRE